MKKEDARIIGTKVVIKLLHFDRAELLTFLRDCACEPHHFTAHRYVRKKITIV